ncbi:MAG: S-layer homology domain-containing protein [Firmicutes bacterium]|nr:S-layer homology domain-containing protein [Bacillota bacterium]
MVRKLAVVVLAVAMVMSCMGLASAAKFPDTAGHKQEAAIERIASLGLVKGYPDGTFKPDAPITRAEFAKVMVCALGLETAAEMMATTPTVFADVPVGYWATGYINVAASQGIVNGYPDGTFKPDAQVTYAEALKMILCALGYRPEVFRTVVWPVTWVAKAMELGLTSGVPLATGAAALPANRGDVARLVDNALTVDKLVQKGYGDEVTYEVKEGETLLKDLGYHKVTPRIVDIYLTDADLAENEVKGSDGETYILPEGTDVVALLGLEVKMWADDDGNVSHYEVATAADKVLYDSVASLPTGKVKLLVKDKEYSWGTDAAKLVNFDDSGTVAVGQYGRFVLDDKGKVVFAVLFDFSTVKAGLVTEATSAKVKYRVNSSTKELKYANYDGVYAFSPQLASLKVEDITADSLIYGWADDNLYLIVGGQKKEGELTAASSSKVTVDGTGYGLPKLSGVSATYSEDNDETVSAFTNPADALANLLGEDVVLILDLDGRVRHVRGEVTAVSGIQFGVALSGTAATFDYPARIKVLTKSGTATYAFEDKGDFTQLATVVDAVYGWTGDPNIVVAFKLNADGEIADDQIAVVKIEGQSASLEPAGSEGGPGWVTDYDVDLWDGPEADKDDDSISTGTDVAYVSSSTLLFNQITEDDKDVKVIAWSDIEDKNLSPATLVVVRETDNLDAVAVWFVDGYSSVVTEALYGVVLDAPWRTAAGWKAKIDVFGEGEKEYLIANDTARGNLAEGYAVTFGLDAAGKINSATRPNTATVTSAVYAISGNYLKFQVEGQPPTSWYRVADGAVMYQVEDDAIDVAIGVGDLEVDDSVKYVLKDNKVVALVREVVTEGAPAPGQLSVTISAPSVFDDNTDKLVVGITNPEQNQTYRLFVLEGTTLVHVSGALQDGAAFTASDMELSGGKQYKAEVRRDSDGAVLATKTFYTASGYPQ